MEYMVITEFEFDQLKELQTAYKKEIKENSPTKGDFSNLLNAIISKQILFYGCEVDGELVASCSISTFFSTFDYNKSGIFEDFYISPSYRHKGIARKIVQYAYQESGVSTLLVGCADCDLDMYKSLGFGVKLGNMLAYE